jgi:hypothetical protein
VFVSEVISPVLYGCETWSLILWEEYKFESEVLRKIFGPKGYELNDKWRKEALYTLLCCYRAYVLKSMIRWTCDSVEIEKKHAYNFLCRIERRLIFCKRREDCSLLLHLILRKYV